MSMLSDLVVVDLTRALAGPHAGQMLGDLGARVIKVETPGTGDDTRGWGPPFIGEDDDRQSTYFMSTNRNKESVTADLKSEDGKELLRRLVERSDVLLENFRTGVLDRLGFSVTRLHEINPRLVIMSITGFGHDGPEGGRAGYDQIAQGEAGLMSLTGPSSDEPYKVGVPIGDLLAGMYGAYGVLAALLERERTGRGRVVRTRPARLAGRGARLPGHPAHHRRRGAAGHRQSPRLDLAVRPLPHRDRARAGRGRQRSALEAVRRPGRPRSRGPPLRPQRASGGPPRRAREAHRGVLRQARRRALAGRAGQGRDPGRQGPAPSTTSTPGSRPAHRG